MSTGSAENLEVRDSRQPLKRIALNTACRSERSKNPGYHAKAVINSRRQKPPVFRSVHLPRGTYPTPTGNPQCPRPNFPLDNSLVFFVHGRPRITATSKSSKIAPQFSMKTSKFGFHQQ